MVLSSLLGFARSLSRKLSIRASLARKKLSPVNSLEYWNARFSSDWNQIGPLQTSIFAAAFCISDVSNHIHDVSEILDFGCGTGESAPALQMRFPKAKISLYDFATSAQVIQRNRYGDFCTILNSLSESDQFDLVYCSNVIEHVHDISGFMAQLALLSRKYLVIQAPWDERHDDGQPLSKSRPSHEHVNTIGNSFMELLPAGFVWSASFLMVPFAWRKGVQVFYVGKRNSSDMNVS